MHGDDSISDSRCISHLSSEDNKYKKQYNITNKSSFVLLWGCRFFTFMLSVVTVAARSDVAAAAEEISYVIEPFEYIEHAAWFTRFYNDAGDLNLTVINKNNKEGDDLDTAVSNSSNNNDSMSSSAQEDEPLFGIGALRVEYTVESTESWGGFVDFGMLKYTHSCLGATHISLWYNNLVQQTLPGSIHLRLILLDDSDCITKNCREPPGQELENYYTFHYVLDDAPGWKELRIPLQGDSHPDSSFWRTGWTGQVGNDDLDANHLGGWRMEFSMDSQYGMGNQSSGVILLDQLSCVGRGELLGAAFHFNSGFANATAAAVWHDRYYESDISKNKSIIDLTNGTLSIDYTIEQTESWGGFIDYEHLARGPAYFNLSGADSISIHFDTQAVASSSERAHMRFILLDGSDCLSDCDIYPGQNLENYYSFHYILDNKGPGHISMLLQGDDDSTSPFWRAGWTGILGNNVLDPSYIKGYRIELNVDSQGDVGSLLSGTVAFADLTAQVTGNTDNDTFVLDETQFSPDLDPVCFHEPDLLFRVDATQFRRVEFLGSECCERCEQDANCLYAFNDGKDCFIAEAITRPDSVQLINTDFMQTTYAAFSTNNAAKRGNFCDRCKCLEAQRLIDCRGSDLAIVPKVFSLPWKPRVLDLRDNPRLLLIGAYALQSISQELEEVRLPSNLRHLPFEGLYLLPALSVVRFEQEDNEHQVGGKNELNNVIMQPNGFYGDVCCNRGRHLNLLLPVSGLTFCDMQVDVPGIDAVYEPFELYIEATSLLKLGPRSNFMGEAAESVTKCAEYCSITDRCNYFSYDARWKQSEHICVLLENNGTDSSTECCRPDHYGDSGGTTPGWTSGYPPRTRHLNDDAKVLITSKELVIKQANGYKTHYEISLGSKPLRGAVWIEPKLTSTETKLNVSIYPKRVVLYDDTMISKIFVEVSNVEDLSTGATLRVSNVINSCDAAFTATTRERMTELSSVIVNVVPKEDMTLISPVLKGIGIAFVVLQGLFSAFFITWVSVYRDRDVVKMSQPIYLIFVALGCFIASLSILPTIVEGEYRYIRDPLTGQESNTLKDDIVHVDAACMAFPWLFNLGFIITFSALFAKIWRVRQILGHAEAMRRAAVRAKDVVVVMVAFTSIEFALLLTWQLVDPLQWNRHVMKANESGYALESAGHCTSDNALSFWIPIAVYNFGCLIYALYLCYVTRHLSTELSEAKWITASIISIFQVLILAVPVLMIAWDQTNAFFFLRSSVVFLISMGVTCFIFVPKFVNLHFVDPRSKERSSVVSGLHWSGSGSSGSRLRKPQSSEPVSSSCSLRKLDNDQLEAMTITSTTNNDSASTLPTFDVSNKGNQTLNLEMGDSCRRIEEGKAEE